jgi:hypothetical protein
MHSILPTIHNPSTISTPASGLSTRSTTYKRNHSGIQPSNGVTDSFSEVSTQSPSSTYTLHSKRSKPLQNPIKGDNHLVKHPHVFRFLYQNINGLRLTTFDKWRATVIRMLDLHCDIVGINEPCANWKLNKLKQICQFILQKVFKNSSMIVSTIPISSDTNYLPGGSTTISLGS